MDRARLGLLILGLVCALAGPALADGGRPHGCPVRAWCGCWLAQQLGISDRALWLARAWASRGQALSGPQPGAIVVWRHHVGKVTAVEGPGRIRVISGNDGNAVRERVRSTAGVIAYRSM